MNSAPPPGTYPFHGHGYGWRAHRWHRGPSRIFWFIAGGVATAWWLKHKDFRCEGGICSTSYSRESRALPPAQAPAQAQEAEPVMKMEHRDGWRRSWRSAPPAPAPPPPSPPLASASASMGWEEERARIRDIGKQAGETVNPPPLFLLASHVS